LRNGLLLLVSGYGSVLQLGGAEDACLSAVDGQHASIAASAVKRRTERLDRPRDAVVRRRTSRAERTFSRVGAPNDAAHSAQGRSYDRIELCSGATRDLAHRLSGLLPANPRSGAPGTIGTVATRDLARFTKRGRVGGAECNDRTTRPNRPVTSSRASAARWRQATCTCSRKSSCFPGIFRLRRPSGELSLITHSTSLSSTHSRTVQCLAPAGRHRPLDVMGRDPGVGTNTHRWGSFRFPSDRVLLAMRENHRYGTCL
jgi:hypothetical protein